MTQRILPLQLNPSFSFADFYPGANRLLVNTLKKLTSGDTIYLWGSTGVGCSHLLQAVCQQQSFGESMYIDLRYVPDPAMLEHLDAIPLLAIDHLQEIVGKKNWQESLFHLYNRQMQQGGILIFAANQAPDQLPLLLADLQSRLKAALIFNVKALSDDDKCEALRLQAKQRGFELPLDVAAYLLRHTSRDWRHLLEQLTILDQAALAAKRRITIPFVRDILKQNNLRRN